MLAFRAPGRVNVYPADAVLSLPRGRHSHGLRRLAVREPVRGSYDAAKAAVDRRCGKVAGKRQLEELVRSAACDIAAFYAMRTPVPCTSEVPLWGSYLASALDGDAGDEGFHLALPAFLQRALDPGHADRAPGHLDQSRALQDVVPDRAAGATGACPAPAGPSVTLTR